MWLWREWLAQPPVGTVSQLAPPLCPLKGSSLIWRGAIVIHRTLGILVTSRAFQAEQNRGICCRSGVKETQLQMASYRASSIEKDMPCCRGVAPCTPTLSVALDNRSIDKPLSRVLIPGFQSLVSQGCHQHLPLAPLSPLTGDTLCETSGSEQGLPLSPPQLTLLSLRGAGKRRLWSVRSQIGSLPGPLPPRSH